MKLEINTTDTNSSIAALLIRLNQLSAIKNDPRSTFRQVLDNQELLEIETRRAIRNVTRNAMMQL